MSWSVTGQVPVKIAGQGILLKSGGIFEVSASTGGRVIDMAVAVGSIVHEGQIVARIAQPELAEHLIEAKNTAKNLKAKQQRLIASGTAETRLAVAYLEEQRRGLEQSIAAASTSLTWLGEKIATQQKLVDEGRLTKQTLITSIQQRDDLRARVDANTTELTQIRLKRLQAEAMQDRDAQALRTQVDEADVQIAQLERQLSAATEVTSPYTGRIIEVLTEQGNMIDRGAPLLRLDLAGRTVKELEAVLYVASRDGKRIKPGMAVHLAPSTVRPEEYGYILGKVTYVSDFPTTSKGMERILKNDELVAALAKGDPPYEIHADLLIDPATVSTYRWSSSKGPNLKIQSGTLCSAQITVETRRPIEMMLPIRAARGQ